MNEVSFMSEHSVEYFLVHQICTCLNMNGYRSIPLFFWSTREGNKLGRECFQDKMVRILAIYPRRPKVTKIYDDNIQFKINHSIFSPSLHLHNFGIPVYVGGPLISALDDFYMDSKMFIAKFNSEKIDKNYMEDEFFGFDKHGKVLSSGSLFQLTEIDDILNTINHDARLMKWSEAVDIFQKRKLHDGSGPTIFLAGRSFIDVNYKPIYFVIQ